LINDLVYYANLVKPGNFTIKYAKDTKVLGDRLNGHFIININGIRTVDTDIISDTPKIFTAELNPGPNEIVVSYVKYQTV
jgi:hypothetical protein